MTPVYHYDLEQRSDEWRLIRRGRFTGTDAGLLLTEGTKRDDRLGVGVETALYLKCAELVSDYQPQEFEKYELRIGREREPEAVERYEDLIFPESVTPCGFVEIGDYFGFSPDGLVGRDGYIEIKCPQAPEYFRYLMTGEINRDYVAQMQWGLWITGRKWCDHVVYNPDFKDCPMHVKRLNKDAKMMELFDRRTDAIKEAMDVLLNWYSAKIEYL